MPMAALLISRAVFYTTVCHCQRFVMALFALSIIFDAFIRLPKSSVRPATAVEYLARGASGGGDMFGTPVIKTAGAAWPCCQEEERAAGSHQSCSQPHAPMLEL